MTEGRIHGFRQDKEKTFLRISLEQIDCLFMCLDVVLEMLPGFAQSETGQPLSEI